MISLFKKTLKLGMCTAGLIGVATIGAFALVGKGRTQAVMHDLHGRVLEGIDQSIDDPSAMRAQLHEMEKEYPERIAQVRRDLAELQTEIRGLERERAVSERVVALADADLQRVETQLAAQSASGETQLVALGSVEIDNRVISRDRAAARLQQIKSTRVSYANRAADAGHSLMYLEKQAGRLEEVLAKLETERAEFQGQILGLSREIEAIARNERLIKMLEKRQRTLDECSRYEAVSLDQINGRLSEIKSRQEAELDYLATSEQETDYEDLARMQLSTEKLEEQHTQSLEQASGF